MVQYVQFRSKNQLAMLQYFLIPIENCSMRATALTSLRAEQHIISAVCCDWQRPLLLRAFVAVEDWLTSFH